MKRIFIIISIVALALAAGGIRDRQIAGIERYIAAHGGAQSNTSTIGNLPSNTAPSPGYFSVVDDGSSHTWKSTLQQILSSGTINPSQLNPLPLATGYGGTATSKPSPVAGTCITIAGTWPGQTISYSCASPTASPTPVATATNGITASLYPGQSVGLTPIAPYSVNANNSASTATPVPVTAAALAAMLSSQCPAQVTTYTGTSSDVSGTYTTPTCNGVTATRLWIRGTGGGGGGGGSGTGGGTGGNGDDSTFGSSFLTASHGVGGGGASGSGGSGGTASGGNLANQSGSAGQVGPGNSSNFMPGGCGGGNPLGVPTCTGSTTGSNGSGCGAGGSGGSAQSGTGTNTNAAGGGGGGYVEEMLTSPSASYAYVAGKYGAIGSAGTSGNAGGHGAPGCWLIVAYWL